MRRQRQQPPNRNNGSINHQGTDHTLFLLPRCSKDGVHFGYSVWPIDLDTKLPTHQLMEDKFTRRFVPRVNQSRSDTVIRCDNEYGRCPKNSNSTSAEQDL